MRKFCKNSWNRVLLKEVANITSGGTPSRKRSDYWNGSIPWVTTGEISSGVITSTKEFITQKGLENSSAKLFPKNTLLIALYGQGKTRGTVAKLNIEATTNQACAAILVNPQYNTDYVFYYLQYKYNELRNISNSGAQKNLNSDVIKKFLIDIPPMCEQRKISRILSIWDAAIECVQKLLENSRQQKKALMQQLLTAKKVFSANHKRWKRVEIGSLLISVKRPVTWDDKATYRLLSVKRRGEGIVFRSILSGSKIKTKKLNFVHEDDIIISKMQIVHGAIGQAKKEHTGCCVSDSYIILSPRDANAVNLGFIAHYFNQRSLIKLAYKNSHGVHIEKMTFDFDSFAKEKIIFPLDYCEQEIISQVLDFADEYTHKIENMLDNITAQKKALMHQLLTGKRRVKPDSEDYMSE